MTHRERVLTSLDHRVPDRTPVDGSFRPEVWEKLFAHFGTRNEFVVSEALGLDFGWVGMGASEEWRARAQETPAGLCLVAEDGSFENEWGVRQVKGEGTELTKRLAERWETEVWEGRSEGVEEHLRELVAAGRDDASHTLRRNADCLRTHQQRLRYHLFRAAGWPLASGVVEGGCKHVIGLRFKRKGTRGSRAGGRAVLHLRVDRLSQRWPLRVASARQTLTDLRQAA